MTCREQSRFGSLGPLVLGALLIGAILRFARPDVFPYLGDEAWTFRHVEGARHGEPWAALGMPSSRGVQNAGMSVWVFIVLGMIGDVSTPTGLVRAVAAFAFAGHVLLLVLPWRLFSDPAERKAWTWAFVLTATNPILVFLERKIWAQSVLPFFQVALIVAWLRRDTRTGAFVWGLVGAVVGQIHMAGFFFAPALVLFTKLFGKHTTPVRPVRWGAWFLGSAVGAAPAVPWLLYLLRERPPPTSSGSQLLRFRLEFYQYFFSDPTGLSGSYVIGDDLTRAMEGPVVAGHPTYIVLLAHVALAIATIALGVRALRYVWTRKHELAALITRPRTETGLLFSATLFGMGVLMTLPSISIHRHYMLATFPLAYAWVARIAMRQPRGERWLAVLFAGGAIVSMGILAFVDDHGGADAFGKSYAAQLRDGTSPEAAKGFRP